MGAPVQQQALDQLAAIPGVAGALVFDAAGAVEASSFPAVYDRAALARLAVELTSDAYFQEWLAGDGAALSLRFADGHVAVRSLGGAWALVLCSAQTNEQLLSMSLTQLVRRLKAGGAGAGPGELPGRPPAAPPPSPRDRLEALVRAQLGEHGAKAVELLAAAGPEPRALAGAVAEVEKMVRLFISKKKAEELASLMREALEA